MAMSKIGYGTPEYKEYEALDHKLWDYGSAYSTNEYECVLTTALDLCTKYRLELKEVYEGYEEISFGTPHRICACLAF